MQSNNIFRAVTKAYSTILFFPRFFGRFKLKGKRGMRMKKTTQQLSFPLRIYDYVSRCIECVCKFSSLSLFYIWILKQHKWTKWEREEEKAQSITTEKLKIIWTKAKRYIELNSDSLCMSNFSFISSFFAWQRITFFCKRKYYLIFP